LDTDLDANLDAELGKREPVTRRSLWLIVPPPPLFIFTFVTATKIHRLWPLPLVPASLAGPARVVGAGVVAVAVALVVTALAPFARRRTTVVPFRAARALVTEGPYRFTRNPMYLALVLAYLGAMLVVGTAWPLVTLPLPIWVIARRVIPFEEESMARGFGDAYRDYQRRVRRWI
jgi:protein-S-isoprenylcysteine O-methyltransferase Ste14